ncbi:hypothetical protein NDU88_004824 [Pleurodeles waltl]|uniref:Gypsy retrotransposon integrase-like protein 1 n=1 Tax=Pleurodeles waltl TaxID=8319 RepID=A0AAV7RGQ9_PLEWA|nr:hypothetical protein NDU88_004824 [Pleurodeles waltl]
MVCSICDQLDGALNEQEWRDAFEADQDIKSVMRSVVMGWSEWNPGDDLSNKYKHVFDELSVVNNLLFQAKLLVVPSDMRKRVLSLAHEGHIGMRATKRRIREGFWGPGVDKSVEHFVRKCMCCAISEKSQAMAPSPVEAVKVPH